MFEEEVNETTKQILEESEREKEIAAAAFLWIYEAVDRMAKDPKEPYQEQAKRHRKMLEDVYAIVECLDYGRTD